MFIISQIKNHAKRHKIKNNKHSKMEKFLCIFDFIIFV